MIIGKDGNWNLERARAVMPWDFQTLAGGTNDCYNNNNIMIGMLRNNDNCTDNSTIRINSNYTESELNICIRNNFQDSANNMHGT